MFDGLARIIEKISSDIMIVMGSALTLVGLVVAAICVIKAIMAFNKGDTKKVVNNFIYAAIAAAVGALGIVTIVKFLSTAKPELAVMATSVLYLVA
jgi:hypothetical protein